MDYSVRITLVLLVALVSLAAQRFLAYGARMDVLEQRVLRAETVLCGHALKEYLQPRLYCTGVQREQAETMNAIPQ